MLERSYADRESFFCRPMVIAPTGGSEFIAYVSGYGFIVVWEGDGEWWCEEGGCNPEYWVSKYN